MAIQKSWVNKVIYVVTHIRDKRDTRDIRDIQEVVYEIRFRAVTSLFSSTETKLRPIIASNWYVSGGLFVFPSRKRVQHENKAASNLAPFFAEVFRRNTREAPYWAVISPVFFCE